MKVIDEIESALTGRVVAARNKPLVSAVINEVNLEMQPHMIELDVRLRIGVTTHCYPQDKRRAIETVKDRILSIIFGELIADVHGIMSACYEDDTEKASLIASNLLDKIR